MLKPHRPLASLAALALLALACGAGGLFPTPRPTLPAPEQWRAPLTASAPSPAALEEGVLLYVGQSSDIAQDLFAHDAATGDRLWTADLAIYSTGDTPPAAGGGLVVIPETRSNTGGSSAGFLAAFDVHTGERRWELPLGSTSSDSASASNPLVAGGQVYYESGFGGPHTLNAADLTGAPVWAYPFEGRLETRPLLAGGQLFAARFWFVDGERRVALLALDAATGALLWEQALPGRGLSPTLAAGEGRLYFNTFEGDVYAVETQSGAIGWTTVLGAPPVFGSPVRAPLLDDGRLYVVGVSGEVAALDPATGDLLWSTALTNFPATGPAAYGGQLFLGDREGYLLALDAATGVQQWSVRNRLRKAFPATEYFPPLEPTPRVYNGVLYFVLDSELVALTLGT